MITFLASSGFRAARALLLFVLGGCNLMNQIPKGGPPPAPPELVQVVRFPTTDNLTLEGWFLPGAKEIANPGSHQPAVLFCHGVQDSADSNMADFIKRAGYTVFSFDYRGFGNSSKADLTAETLAEDSWAAFEYLRSRPDVDPDRIAVYGHSLGAALALSVGAHAFRENIPVACVVSASAFSTYRRAMNDFFPVGGFILGGSDTPDPEDWAAQLGNIPLLITHGKDDDILPVYHAQRIASAAKDAGVPTEVVIASSGGHIIAYIFHSKLPNAILDFLARHIGPPVDAPGGADTSPAPTAP
ncbi:MAG: alpha/beta fold hydrolase [Phycisphaeraceae bacterium]|nr:alpha/beta fold hydrolase [Phycisphaeraceae bacterium]